MQDPKDTATVCEDSFTLARLLGNSITEAITCTNGLYLYYAPVTGALKVLHMFVDCKHATEELTLQLQKVT